MNRLKITFLLTCLTLLLVAMGRAIGGQSGMFIAFALACGMNFFSYWYSDKIILKMYKAREVSESENPVFYSMVRRLSQQANMPMWEATPATSHLFIVNPLCGAALLKLFSTHPPMEERIARLEAMALSRR